ncbi:pilus assembly protein PilP [Halomonas cibimaris]|uniref:Pilus assembly protein PilP n=1 Tax=Halomonas cibimaris TaxID=657012 RepID=A0ABP7LFW7_9GAMM
MMRLLAMAAVVMLVAGCTDPGLDRLSARLDDMQRAADKPASVSVPAMPVYTPVDYAYAGQRSPFMAPQELARQNVSKTFDGELAPDQNRTPEPLERYPLPELELVGTMHMGERQRALIQTPQGDVTAVRVGSYIGVNFGRVDEIAPRRLVVVERIFTPRKGWQKRRVDMALARDENGA